MTMPAAECDLYAELGLDTDATGEQVRRAYRALARRHHPDLNPDQAASDRFARVAAAYAVLSDPDRRAAYDHARADPPGQDSTAGAGGAAESASTANAGMGGGRVYDDYVPAGQPVAFDDYAPVTDTPPPAEATSAGAGYRYGPGPHGRFPAGWIDHRRLAGRLLLRVWRLAPLPANRAVAGLIVLATLGVAYIAAASHQTMPIESRVVGALTVLALACWSIRALVWTVLHVRGRRAVKEPR